MTRAADAMIGLFPLEAQKVSKEDTAPPYRKATVLLAEDDDDVRSVTAYTLEAHGYRVVACTDALCAADCFVTMPPVDLLLTDYQMPGKTGVELARELVGLRPSLPVVIVTGSHLSAETLDEIAERGWQYLSKPCPVARMTAALEHALRTSVSTFVSQDPAG